MGKGSVCTKEMGPQNPGWAHTPQGARWFCHPEPGEWAQMESQATGRPNEGDRLPGGCTVGAPRRPHKGASLPEALPNGLAAGTLIQVLQGSLLRPWCRAQSPRRTSRSLVFGPAPTHLESLVDVCIIIHHLSFPWFSLGALQDETNAISTQGLGQQGPDNC